MEEERQVYLALGIGISEVKAVLWEKSSASGEEKGNILAYGESEFYQREEELMEAVRESLRTAWSLASPRWGKAREIAGVIFSVPHFWLMPSFRPEKMALLRNLVRELSAPALGFVSEVEILISFLQEKEGKFLNLVVVSIGDEQINVVPIVQGKILGSQLVERSNDLALDLEEGLSRFEKEDGFAPRFLLLGSGNLEEIKQKILTYPWLKSEKPLFFHLPKVEIFPSQLILDTLITKIGKERKETEGDRIVTDLATAARLGFHQGEDIARLSKAEKEEPPKNENFSSVSSPPLPPSSKKAKEGEKKKLPFSSVKLLFQQSLAKAKEKFSFLRRQKHLWLAPVLGIAAFLVLMGILWWFLPKAQVVLLATPRFSQEKFSLTVSPEAFSLDDKERIIPGQRLEVTLNGEKEIAASGEKEVGEKAQGEVTIYNGTDIEKTFPKGTLIKGPGDLRFLTLEEVTVASRSGSLIEGWTAGKKKVKVEAEKFGPDYNLAKGIEFRVDSFSKSDFVAKNEEDFQGGTSRHVPMVTKEDLEQLRRDLGDELLSQAQEKLRKEAKEKGLRLTEESLKSVEKQSHFSAAAGEESEKVSLSLVLSVSGLAFKEEDLDKLARAVLEDKIPPDYQLGEEREWRFEFVGEKEGGAVFEARIKATLYPRLDEEKIKREIKGKKLEVARERLLSLPGISNVRFVIWPHLPRFLWVLPHQENRIKIEMKTEE